MSAVTEQDEEIEDAVGRLEVKVARLAELIGQLAHPTREQRA